MVGERTLTWAAWIGFASAALPLLLLGSYVWPASDDFSHWNSVAEAGSPFAYAWHTYSNWSGRFTTELLNGLAFSSTRWLGVVAMLPAVALAAWPIAFALCLRALADVRWSLQSTLLLATVGIAAAWFGLAPFLAECVFWLTGGIGYTVPLLLGVAWLAALLSAPAFSWWLLLLVPLSAAVGMLHEQLSAALLIAGLMWLAIAPGRWRATLPPLAVLGAATLAMIAAPGNGVRADVAGQHVQLGVSMIGNLPSVLSVIGPTLLAPSVVGVVLGLVLGARGAAGVGTRPWFEWSALVSAAALGAVLPVAAAPLFVADLRTGFFPSAFVLAAATGWTCLATSTLGPWPPAARATAMLGAGLVAAYLVVATGQLQLAMVVRPAQEAAWAQIAQSPPDVDVAFTAPPAGAAVLYSPALSEDSTNWVNVAIARFYHVRSVRAAQRI